MKIKRKVVCVYGNFDDKSDFVLEPYLENCYDDSVGVFEIEGEEQEKFE